MEFDVCSLLVYIILLMMIIIITDMLCEVLTRAGKLPPQY